VRGARTRHTDSTVYFYSGHHGAGQLVNRHSRIDALCSPSRRLFPQPPSRLTPAPLPPPRRVSVRERPRPLSLPLSLSLSLSLPRRKSPREKNAGRECSLPGNPRRGGGRGREHGACSCMIDSRMIVNRDSRLLLNGDQRPNNRSDVGSHRKLLPGFRLERKTRRRRLSV